jgi:hypothetical protein
MGKIILIVSAVLASVLISPVSVYAVSFGNYSCGEIVQFDRDNNKLQMQGVSLRMAGFIFGRNLGTKVDKFPKTDTATLFLLLAKHCSENANSDSARGMAVIYYNQKVPK